MRGRKTIWMETLHGLQVAAEGQMEAWAHFVRVCASRGWVAPNLDMVIEKQSYAHQPA